MRQNIVTALRKTASFGSKIAFIGSITNTLRVIAYIGSIIISFGSYSQIVKGYIYDSKSKETLLGATLYNPKTKGGTITNNYGFYSLSIPKEEKSTLIVSYVGYDKQIISVQITKDTTINFYLNACTTLGEVVISDKSSEKRFVSQSDLGKITLQAQSISAIPTIGGESDLLKALQTLPGVKSGTEGSTGLYVRGGNVDQNLYLIDGIPIYNPNHLMGFISTFNTGAIKNINFYKGSFPSQYGERVSSVVDVRTKDGNNEKIKGEASLGLISAHLDLEGPIVKDKTTFSFSARRTYLDLLLKPIINAAQKDEDSQVGNFGYHFSDLNMKVTHRFNEKNRLTACLYWGEDKFALNINDKDNSSVSDVMKNNIKWGNLIGTIGWLGEINNSLFSNLSISYNRYKSSIITRSEFESKDSKETQKYSFEYDFLSSIEDWSIRNDYNYYLNSLNYVTFGIGYTYHTYSPEITSAKEEATDVVNNFLNINNRVYANELTAYIEDEITLNEKLLLTPGIHYNIFSVQGKTYNSLEPRVSLRYSLRDNLSLKAGYAMMNQYVHLLANGIISSPTDLWVPITKNIKPVVSNQVSCGVFYSLKDIAEASVEGYYKVLNNVIDYKDGVSTLNSSVSWQDKVAQGKGESYGVEFLIKKDKGNNIGWISYTLSWSYRKFAGGEINNGKRYFDRYDSRHQLNIVYTHKFGKKFDITLSWVLNSGARTSVPVASYYLPMANQGEGSLVYVYDQRNNFKMPLYHRLDLNLNHNRKTRHGQIIWSLNVYNAYNRKNAFMVFTQDKPNTLKAVSIMPIIPTISCTYKFN